jgi:2-amino-4-hydroxy-6-hydroxymethyldihydropteridine diphosphokinase
MTTNQPVTVYLGLGSNLGDRMNNLGLAISFLSERLKIEDMSAIYQTEPVGDSDQPKFLNMATKISTRLPVATLLTMAKGIEAKLGRVPINTPRPIDIDILFYGDQVINNPPGLIVPHPRLAERAFVLVPLADIAPDLVHPVVKKTIRRLLEEVEGQEGVVKFGELAVKRR